jgi:hypothetical protein
MGCETSSTRVYGAVAPVPSLPCGKGQGMHMDNLD